MEYVPDVFRNHISSETPLPAERVVEIGREISLALSHAHSYDVVHRGIKPQNILLTKDGIVKVTDFGIARAMEASSVRGLHLEQGRRPQRCMLRAYVFSQWFYRATFCLQSVEGQPICG